MEYAIAKVSTKGQIVIPSKMRENIHEGDEFIIIKDKDRLILKNMQAIAAGMKDDLVFADEVEKAWKDYDKGKFKKKSKADFLKDLNAC